MLADTLVSYTADGVTGSNDSVGVFGGVAGILGALMCKMGANSFLVTGWPVAQLAWGSLLESHSIRYPEGRYVLNSCITLGFSANNSDTWLTRPGTSILESHYVNIKCDNGCRHDWLEDSHLTSEIL